MNAPAKSVCLVIGAGPGNGAAFARRFAAAGHRLVLAARDVASLATIAADLPDAHPCPYDAADPASAAEIAQIESRLGRIDTLVYNAGAAAFGSIEQISLDDFEQGWRVNALGLAAAAKAVIPGMTGRRRGNIVVIGATASLRGGANFAAFASAKAAQRNLAQSLARHLGPQGVHVSHVVIDGVIDSPRTRERFGERPEASYLKADDIAEAVYGLTCQQPSAWTFELDLRPAAEKW
ncbi:MAG: SDR family NAD(P)-dependent oxidoreductase [Gammaproteobacteria bacterium]|nr:SDR family NAD(P)-dependent oxidoreductase [Gammaproteobacteria bacterium]MBI5616411.1 SDR family NAD(P)-dependent oxidoreductase [Gammaproteobacteria bacterium]